MNALRLTFLASLMAAAMATRLIPHPDNFVAMGAVAIFAGGCQRGRSGTPLLALIAIAALLATDILIQGGGRIGLHSTMAAVYLAFAVNIGISYLLSRWAAWGIGAATVLGTLQFFLTTNFAFWLVWGQPGVVGLVQAYGDAVPFLRPALLADVVYVPVLFGLLAVAEALVPALRVTPKASQPSVEPA